MNSILSLKMEKNKNIFLYALFFALGLTSCSTPMVTSKHSLGELIDLEVATDNKTCNFNNMAFNIKYAGDAILTPHGCNVDKTRERIVNKVEQTYNVPQPGYLLFNKIADVFKDGSATVYRQYTNHPVFMPGTEGVASIELFFQDFEFHTYRVKKDKEEFILSRAVINFNYSDNNKNISDKIEVEAKVRGNEDVFLVLAQQFALNFREIASQI